MPKVLFTSLNAETGPHREILEQAGFETECVNRELNIYEEDPLISALEGVSAVLAGSEPYTRRVIQHAPELRVIARTGVGFDAIDLSACDEADIAVTTTPGVNHHAVAEHTIALMMGVARGFPANDQNVRRGEWIRIAYPRVMGRTMGLVGLGRIGQAVATRAVGLGLKVIAFEPHPDPEFVAQWGIELVDLPTLFKTAQIISLHCPLTPETKHLINRDSLATIAPGSILINTARGGLVDESALIEALESGHLQGAGLDVFEVEPLDTSSPLTKLNNVLLAGHLAGLDIESHNGMFRMAAEIIRDMRQGQWPAECIQNLSQVKNWSWDRSAGE